VLLLDSKEHDGLSWCVSYVYSGFAMKI